MGCGASVVKGPGNRKKSSKPIGQQSIVQTAIIEAVPIMASLQSLMAPGEHTEDEATKMVHVIDISGGSFPENFEGHIECNDIVEFTTKGTGAFDVVEVYKDGDDYYPAVNGYTLRNIKSRSPENDRRLIFPFALTQSDIELYFCIIPSLQRQTIEKTRKCPKAYCEKNTLKVHKAEIKFSLTDEKEDQKIYLHKGESIDIEWITTRNPGYRIEEKKYCPVSDGLYTVDRSSDNVSTRYLSRGKFSKTFTELGMSFLCRMNDKNQIHDIAACIVRETFKVKHIEIADDKIEPNIIWVQQNDFVRFAWKGKRKQTVVQIEPFTVTESKQQSIELKTSDENFFWPHEPSRHGCMYHQFVATGIYCFKAGDNQIGTIIVEPHRNIYSIQVFGDSYTHKVNTNDFIQFHWKATDAQEELLQITMDSNSSVVPDIAGGLTGVFDCALHKCNKIEQIFRQYFHTCEIYLLNIPQHGLYNFAYSDKPEKSLISVIVENGVDNHRVAYNEENSFEPNPLIVNRFDQVWFDSSSATIAAIYRTDELGNPYELEKPLFQPQPNSINYYMQEFQALGVYYFSTDINSNNKKKQEQKPTQPLAIVVIPEIRFHYRSIGKDNFDSDPIITNINDFVIWQFNEIISHRSVQLAPNETYEELIGCHERAIPGRHRQCLAIECTIPGTFFFANPDFERVYGSLENRLLSTIIIDPPFSHNCFVTSGHDFVPHVLHISENDTVSWALCNNEKNHQISVQLGEADEGQDEASFVDLSIAQYVPGVYHLHTFKKQGQYTVRSNRFHSTATVFVYSETSIRNEKRQLQEPKILEEIDTVNEFGKQIHFTCPNRNAILYYTLDGSIPTRRYESVLKYDPKQGVCLVESGLHILRAYSTEDNRLSSAIITSSPTFVMENKEIERMKERRKAWSNTKIKLSVSLELPNKIYGTITVESTTTIDFIDHFELCINDVAQKVNIKPEELEFSAQGFAAGEQYEVFVTAHATDDISDVEPIASNKGGFEIQREYEGGGPLISLAVSHDQSTLLLMWAHIGDHVTEYIVYVDDVETKIITDRDFSDFFAIHFHSAQQRREYVLRVEAKIKDSTEKRKSNDIFVTPPLDLPVKNPALDRYFPYIIINGEKTSHSAHPTKGSDRLSSSKLSIRSSSSLPPSSRSPAASSRANIHITDLNKSSVTSNEIVRHQHDDNHDDKTNKLTEEEEEEEEEERPPQSPIFDDTSVISVKIDKKAEYTTTTENRNKNSILSEADKHRAQNLLEKLTQAIENRSTERDLNSTHTNNSFVRAQRQKDDQLLLQRSSTSTHDPFTDRLPPKPRRRSSTLNKTVGLAGLQYRRPEANRKIESLPITNGLRKSVPTIVYKRNPKGITLFWKIKSPAMSEHVRSYRIMVDQEPYGKLIEPDVEPKFQINLAPGRHKCQVEVLPKESNDEVFKTNTLTIDILPESGLKYERAQQREPSDIPVNSVLEQTDAPVPKLNVQTISPSSIRAQWYLDRALPTNVFVALFELHIRGQDFPDHMRSDEKIEKDGYTEHAWYVVNAPLEIQGISEEQEYTFFVRALFHAYESNDLNYVTTTSDEVITQNYHGLIELLTRPLLQVASIGLQMATLSWTLDSSVDQSLVKGYRIFLNSKPTEILLPNQHEYEFRNLKPGTSNEIQVSVTSDPDFVAEKTSEPIRLICPQRPQAPTIQAMEAEKPFSIQIQWTINKDEQDVITSFKIFLDGKLHGVVETNGRQSFKYDFLKLKSEQTYTIYIKSFIEQAKLGGYSYQCEIESNASNELSLKCATPPKGTMPRIESMDSNGIAIVWDPPAEYGDVRLTGYEILKNGRSLGKSLSTDKQRVLINDLEIGNRYSFQVVPITNQPGGILLRKGDEYDSDRHSHYLPGPKLEVEYTDLVLLPKRFWIENITGHSVIACWSPIDESKCSSQQPDHYKLSIWKDSDSTSDTPKVVELPNDKTDVSLKSLQSKTIYKIQLEAIKRRRHQTSNDSYIVSAKSEILTCETGRPPDVPSNIYRIACTNTNARFSFDAFTERNAEIIALRVNYKPTSTETNPREISMDIPPDSTEFILSNLIERTEYEATIYALTEEYLYEKHYQDVSRLPLKLEPSDWLSNKSFQFQTSGFEPVSKINIKRANTELIELEWTLPKVYGSTKYISQVLRWKLEHGGEEHSIKLDRNTKQYTVHERLPSGSYKISLDSYLSVKVNLEDDNDDTNRKELRLTTTETASVRFHAPVTCERPEIYLTGYTTDTIDLEWNKPNLFSIIDHPEKVNEQLKIHRRLLAYRVEINGRQQNKLEGNQYKCTLTKCQPDEEYKVQLCAQTIVQYEYMDNMITNGTDDSDEPDELLSKPLRVRMLKSQDLLRSFQANFEFNHNDSNENIFQRQNEMKPLGKINVKWEVSNSKNILHYILQWHSSKDLYIQQKIVKNDETSSTIDALDEKHLYSIGIFIVTNDNHRLSYEELTIPIPGEPDAPNLWLVKTSDTSFIVEWSEPKLYGIPVIGFQLYIEGKKKDDIIQVNLRRAEIPSRINRSYQVTVCALTNNPSRPRSVMSATLSVITTPTTSLIPTMYYDNDDGNATSFDCSVARIIPLTIESVNEEKLHIDWTSFLPTEEVRSYYIHYTCLNNGEVKSMKVSKRFRHSVLRGLRPGFTYGISVIAVNKTNGVLYTSDKSTVQMNAPPNAPIVAISERTTDHVKLEWRPAASYGEITVVGYKIFVNNRLAAILAHDQLSYTLTNGLPCDIYIVHVQALSSDKNVLSPMSRDIKFAWPGVKPGAFKRIDDGQTGSVIVVWENPQLEDETERLLGYRIRSENVTTLAVRSHGEYDAATNQATIHNLTSGKYRLWLEIQTENHCVCARPIIIVSGRFGSLRNRASSSDASKCYIKNQRRFRSPAVNNMMPPIRHTQYS
ncbi:unnamed protein product [Rotaria socialis]